MSARDIVMAAAGAAGVDNLYVDDVFSTYLYTGNGSTQTITNGIDLAGKGGLVWGKERIVGASSHSLTDSARGVGNTLSSDITSAQFSIPTSITAFNSNGFSLGANSSYNQNTRSFVSWTFRKAAKFFDCGTYTGNGTAGRQIPHSLGVVPGMVIVKSTSVGGNWAVYHRSIGNTGALFLNDTIATSTSLGYWNNTSPTDTAFTVGSDGNVNQSSQSFVWYAFAHDASADGIIQCGSFTTDGSGNATVTLGWETQFVKTKRSASVGNWNITDTMRGMPVDSNGALLNPNLSSTESSISVPRPNATGFTVSGFPASTAYIYLAIRRPNKPPTTGTQVYSAIAYTGDGVVGRILSGAGFSPDTLIGRLRGSTDQFWSVIDKIRGTTAVLATNSTIAETSELKVIDFTNDGFIAARTSSSNSAINAVYAGSLYVQHALKRAVGVFDVVCYTGDNTSIRTLNHSLGVAPELIIHKSRSASASWWVYSNTALGEKRLLLHDTASASGSPYPFVSTPSASQFGVEYLGGSVNVTGATYVCYLFATKAGVSKCGSYTGNGSSQAINCGFSAGARFVLIRRTDSTGDWYVWDTARGIIAGNDPHLSLNATAAEVTTNDSIDPDSTGFVVNQLAATNINVNAATYIYLALA